MTPGGVVTTIGGTAGLATGADGVGGAARFSFPNGVAVDTSGNLYVADSGNNRISSGWTEAAVGMSLVGGTPVLVWSALAGNSYQLQYKTQLTQTNWTNLGGPITATGSVVTVTDPATDQQRFYQVVLP